MTRSAGFLTAVLTALCVANAHVAAARAECALSGNAVAKIAAVEPRMELRLEDGRLLRLVGIEAASPTSSDPGLAERVRSRFEALVAGQSVSTLILDRAPDRWGRLAAMVFPEKSQVGGLAELALAAGLARFNAEPAAHPCRDSFLAAEAKARSAEVGLWRDPYYAVLAADKRTALDQRSATLVLAEGRLTRVDADAYRTKLRFAAQDRNDHDSLVATILPRTMKLFETQGVSFSSLIGRRLRLRGLLDLRFGPELELTGPDAIEILPVDAVPPEAPAAGHG